MSEQIVLPKSGVTLESLGFNMTPKGPSNVWREQKFIMLGESKVGKTEFWADPRNYFIRTEPGHGHVTTYGDDCRDMGDFHKIRAKLLAAKAAGVLPFETVVIDTGDRFLDCITEDVLDWARQKYNKMADDITGIGDVPEGNGWFMLKQKTNMILKGLEELGCAVVLIFHVTQDQRDDEATKKKYTCATINVGGKSGKAILAWADHILHVKSMYVGEQIARAMITRQSKYTEAGSRLKTMPPQIPWGTDPKENYAKFRALFV